VGLFAGSHCTSPAGRHSRLCLRIKRQWQLLCRVQQINRIFISRVTWMQIWPWIIQAFLALIRFHSTRLVPTVLPMYRDSTRDSIIRTSRSSSSACLTGQIGKLQHLMADDSTPLIITVGGRLVITMEATLCRTSGRGWSTTRSISKSQISTIHK